MKRLFASLILAVTLLGSALAYEPGTFDLVMQAGEDYVLQLQLNSCADNPLPIPPAVCKVWEVTDLTGYSYRSQFRSAAAPAGVVYANMSCIFSNITAGKFNVKLSRAQTAANSGRSGVWDLQQTDSGGNVTYIAKGKAAVTPTVTR